MYIEYTHTYMHTHIYRRQEDTFPNLMGIKCAYIIVPVGIVNINIRMTLPDHSWEQFRSVEHQSQHCSARGRPGQLRHDGRYDRIVAEESYVKIR